MPSGTLFIVSAPSGAGKTSLVKALRSEISGISLSVSHTTRSMRPGEENGVDYHFVAPGAFEELIAAGDLLEYAEVFGNFYGTSRSAVEAQLQQGEDVLLEIDWQGARQIREQMPENQSIFILPPSREALQQRLEARGQDSDEVISKRMLAARAEMVHFNEYDYLVVNDDFDVALSELRSIVLANRARTARQAERYASQIAELLA
ncbi:MAG: guanylate kinase [Thiotrichales bacterium]